jgi:ATP-binding cassette, subfamily B, multidrug efflux pump
MKELFKLKYFVLPYWKRSIAALLLLVGVVLMDLSVPWFVKRIIDQGITGHNQTIVIHTALIMIGISLLSTLFAIGNNMLSVQVGEGVGRDIRESLFLKIQNLSFGNIDRFKTGQLIVRLTSDVNAFKSLTQISLRIGTRAPLLMIGSLVLMFETNLFLALSVIPILIITSIIIIFFIYKTEPLFRFVQQKLDNLNNVLQENILGVRLVKSFVRSEYEVKRFENTNEDYTNKSIRVMQFMSVMTPALTIFINIGVVVIIWIGGIRVVKGEMTIGQIVAFTNYLLTTMTPLILMTMLSNVWASGMVSAKRVYEVLNDVPDIQDVPDPVFVSDNTDLRIVFDNVSFGYNNSSEKVLSDINLIIEPGKTLAILGATGSGKSTIINLVPRFYDVTKGQILVNGVDIKNINQDSLLKQIGIVPQESILFSGTIKENISYGRANATDEEIIEAAKSSQAHEFISKLKDGYNSRVEQRGVNFSGGQKQRIAIARALLPRPKILILDDSTSAVDVETENKIQDALNSEKYKCTVLIVAQRISTVLKADKIIVIDKGRISAEGTHNELIKLSQIYKEIYKSQLGDGFGLDDLSFERFEAGKF